MNRLLYTLLLLLCFPCLTWALTPIARTDVVPYQRVEYGTTFKFGVVAFSKAGIDYVSFAIASGTATYTGSSPKTSSAMALNTRLAYSCGDTVGSTTWGGWPGVWEYYIEIPSSDFSIDGTFTVTPTVYGDDAGSRALSAVTMIVEATGAGTHNYAYVNPSTGNDSTCSANSTDRCLTIEKAVELAQTANSGSSDGNIIYLDNGTYSAVGSHSTSTSGEWLTITAADGASRDSIIINDGGSVFTTTYLKFDGVTIESNGKNDYVINNTVTNLWTNNCKITNSLGRWGGTFPNQAGNGDYTPIKQNSNVYYSTNDYTTDVDRAYGSPTLVRNATIWKISEDGSQNGNFFVNIRIDDQDPSDEVLAAYPHADSLQLYGGSGDINQIAYNFYGTNLHYQGLFIDSGGDSPNSMSNKAFVNCFLEMREPGRKQSAEGNVVLSSGTMSYTDQRSHYLWWHCAFPYTPFKHYVTTGDGNIDNSSFIGNIFYEWATGSSWSADTEVTVIENGNGYSNEALYNHYYCSETISGSGVCDNTYAKAPDSSSGRTTYTEGSGSHPEVLDLDDNTTYVDFGIPDVLTESGQIIDALPSNLTGIPADVLGNARDSTPDKGAFEIQSPAWAATFKQTGTATISNQTGTAATFNQ